MRYDKLGFSIVRCVSCWFMFVDPMPSALTLKAYYEGEYRTGGYRICAEAAPMRRAMFERRLAGLAPYGVSAGRMLDIGCATGVFLEVAEHAGWDVYGVEFSEEAARRAERLFPGRITRGSVASAPFPDGFFDLVTMFDVIEHCADPLAELRSASRLLKPRGVLALTTPNITSLPARLMGRYYPYVNPPNHLTYFSPRTIAAALRMADFELRTIRRLTKTFSIAYLLSILPVSNPRLFRIADPLARILPNRLRSLPCGLYVGEMFVVAQKASLRPASRVDPDGDLR